MDKQKLIINKKISYLSFFLNDNEYLLPSDSIVEIIKLPTLNYPQTLPFGVIGLLQYNNLTINIYDLRFFFKQKIEKYLPNNYIIMLKTDENIFGIIADKINNIIDIPSENLKNIQTDFENKIVEYTYNKANTINISAFANLTKEKDNIIEAFDIKMLFPQEEASKIILQNNLQTLNEKKLYAIANTDINSFLEVKIKGNIFYIKTSFIQQIVKSPKLTKIPNKDKNILGIISLNDEFITILDLKDCIGLSSDEFNNVIIINYQNFKMGLYIDEYLKFKTFQTDISTNSKEYIIKIIEDNQINKVLNISRIIDELIMEQGRNHLC